MKYSEYVYGDEVTGIYFIGNNEYPRSLFYTNMNIVINAIRCFATASNDLAYFYLLVVQD